MPQLDKIIIFPQLFWLFFILAFFYFILSYFFLPKFLFALKSRKIVLDNFQLLNLLSNRNKLSQKRLTKLITNTKSNFFKIESITKKDFTNFDEVDKHFLILIENSCLYCNNALLKSIPLFPKFLNVLEQPNN